MLQIDNFSQWKTVLPFPLSVKFEKCGGKRILGPSTSNMVDVRACANFPALQRTILPLNQRIIRPKRTTGWGWKFAYAELVLHWQPRLKSVQISGAVSCWHLFPSLFPPRSLISSHSTTSPFLSATAFSYFHWAYDKIVNCSPPRSSLCPYDFPGKNTGVDCHFLLWGSSQTRDWTTSLALAGRFFTTEPPGTPLYNID